MKFLCVCIALLSVFLDSFGTNAIVPPVNRTSNNMDFKKNQLTCKKIRNKEDRRQKQCQDPLVRENCPQSCGIFCMDEPAANYTLINDSQVEFGCDGLDSDEMKELWCGQRKSGRLVKNACPYACNECLEFVPLLEPIEQITCEDDPDFIIGEDPKRDCAWAGKKSRAEKQCNKMDIQEACAASCKEQLGTVCDVEGYRFDRMNNSTATKPCRWLLNSKKRRGKYCEDKGIKNNCGFSCSLDDTIEEEGDAEAGEENETAEDYKLAIPEDFQRDVSEGTEEDGSVEAEEDVVTETEQDYGY